MALDDDDDCTCKVYNHKILPGTHEKKDGKIGERRQVLGRKTRMGEQIRRGRKIKMIKTTKIKFPTFILHVDS